MGDKKVTTPQKRKLPQGKNGKEKVNKNTFLVNPSCKFLVKLKAMKHATFFALFC